MPSLLERGRAAYPDLRIGDATFAGHLSYCAAGNPDLVPASSDLFVEDLYLACACLQRVEGAAETFRRKYGKTIRTALAALSASRAFRDEAEQQVYEQLLLGGPPQPPRIRSYGGHGPLARWVTVVAQHTGLMMLRSDAAQARARDAAAIERLETSVHGEIAFLKAEVRSVVDQALTDALRALPRRDRVVLHLHLVGGAGVKKIGSMYGVSPSTVSRWLAQTRDEIAQQVHGLLRTRLRLAPDEVESLMALVLSQLDISLSGLLAM